MVLQLLDYYLYIFYAMKTIITKSDFTELESCLFIVHFALHFVNIPVHLFRGRSLKGELCLRLKIKLFILEE